jgi:hypothetical protein
VLTHAVRTRDELMLGGRTRTSSASAWSMSTSLRSGA